MMNIIKFCATSSSYFPQNIRYVLCHSKKSNIAVTQQQLEIKHSINLEKSINRHIICAEKIYIFNTHI